MEIGTQFGKLIAAYKKWSSKEAVEAQGIEELLRIYVKFNEEAASDATLQEEARDWFVRMEKGDIAALLHRKETYHFDKCLYVTGLEQTLHFKQIFQAIEVMGYDWKEELVHVPYGLVSLKGEKLSTRNGNTIYAEDILKEAIGRALNSIEGKNPQLKDKEKVAELVGVGAVIFHDLYHQRIKNVDFLMGGGFEL